MISLAQKELDKAVTTMLHLGKHGAFRKHVSLGVFGLEGFGFFHTENIKQSGALKPFFEGKHTQQLPETFWRVVWLWSA